MQAAIRRIALIFVLISGLLLTGAAYAHAEYLRSEPGDGALLAAPPARVEIWFTQELFRHKGDNTIQVFDPEGSAVQIGELQIDNDDRKYMWVELPSALKPGKYRVEWKNVSSEDGDSHKGSFNFTYDPQASMTHTPTESIPPAGITVTETAMSPTSPILSTNQAPQNTTAPYSTEPTPSSNDSGNCLPGMLTVGSLAGVAQILRRRRSDNL